MGARWGAITSGEIAAVTGGRLLRGPERAAFASLSTDSRKVLPGQIFWALKGEKMDGHDFAAEAIRKGATGAVVQEDRMDAAASNGAAVIMVPDTLKALGDLAAWWRHQHPVRLAAITGSMGKTTTKSMAAAILGLSRQTLSNHGNFNNLIGLPLSLLQLSEEHQSAVLEMGMNHRGEIARLTEIADPDVGLITNVAGVHLEGLGSIEGVARAKAELVEKMSTRSTAILNGDDALLMEAASPFGRKTMTFGLGSRNDLRACNIRDLGREGSSFELCHRRDRIPVRLALPGAHNVMNALAASAIALSLEASYESIAEALSSFEGIQGRFTVTSLPAGAVLVDDTYNSNPSSLAAALGHLKKILPQGGRMLVGLGDMLELGADAEAAHVEAGARVATLGVHLFVAMGMHAEQMIRGAIQNGLPREKTAIAASHEEMIRIFQTMLKNGDLVFLKGSRRVGLDRVSRGLRNERSLQ